MKRIALTLAALMLTASPAWADVITPDQQACENATKGAACTFNESEGATNPGPDVIGTCEPSTCYTNEACDAGSDGAIQHEPGVCTVPVACLSCQASDGGTSTTSDGGTETHAAGDNQSSGCDVAPGGGLSSFGALLVAAIVPLVLRRRKRKAS